MNGGGVRDEVGRNHGATTYGLRFVICVGLPVLLQVAAETVIEGEGVIEDELLVVEHVHRARSRIGRDEDRRAGGGIFNPEPGIERYGEDTPLLPLEGAAGAATFLPHFCGARPFHD